MDNKKFKINGYLRDADDILEEKQRIAIEKYGEIFEDQVFFELELKMNDELARELSREYNKRVHGNRRLN